MKSPQKHKLYLEYPTNIYDGLITTFSDNQDLIKKINLIKIGIKFIKNSICDIIGIGKDAKNNITLNFYFMFKED